VNQLGNPTTSINHHNDNNAGRRTHSLIRNPDQAKQTNTKTKTKTKKTQLFFCFLFLVYCFFVETHFLFGLGGFRFTIWFVRLDRLVRLL